MDLAAVFVAGLLTFLSPCVLPLVPVYLSILSVPGESRFRAGLASAAFAAGFTIVFSLLGLTATAIGRLLMDHRALFQQVGGIVVLLLGLRFLGYLRIPWLDDREGAGASRFQTRFHYLNAFVLGLLFAFAWSPCIGSVLGAVLTWTSLSTSDPLVGMGYLATYSLGFALPLIAVALLAGPALAALRRARRFIPVFEKVTGVLLVASGFLLATDRLGLLDLATARQTETPAPVTETAASPEGETCGMGAIAWGSCTSETSEPVPTLYEFYSPNCPICLKMIPVVNVLKHDCAGKRVDIRAVDVSTPEGRNLSRRFGIRGVPVFVFVDREDREVARLVGYQTIDALRQAMSVLTGESCPAFRSIPDIPP